MQPSKENRRFPLLALALSLALLAGAYGFAASEAQAQGIEDNYVDVIVELDEAFAPGGHAANKQAAASIASNLGIQASHTYGTALFGFAGPVPIGRLVGLEHDPRVAYVELDQPVTIAAPPAGVGGGGGGGGGNGGGGNGGGSGETASWGYDRIGAVGLLNTGEGVHVYVLDTGIDADHEDLVANLAPSDLDHHAVINCGGIQGTCSKDWDDDNHHGTNVAGIIGAAANSIGVIGVAPGVVLHAVKVLDDKGTGADSGVIAGIDWIAGRQEDAINANNAMPVVANMSFETENMSKSGSCSASGYTSFAPSSPSFGDSYNGAVCRAANLGVIFAAAAGNRGADAATSVPAAYDDAVITASATYKPKRGVDGWSFLSNWGDDAGEACCPRGSAPVALAAPGEDILTTWNDGGYDTNSGTSFAAPHVAGAIALYLTSPGAASLPNYDAFQSARDALVDSAEPIENNVSDRLAGRRNPHEEDMLDVRLLE